MSFILNHFFKHFSLLLHVSIAYRLSSSGSTYSTYRARTQIQDMLPQQYHNEKVHIFKT